MTKENLITVPVGTTLEQAETFCISIAWKSCWWWTTITNSKA